MGRAPCRAGPGVGPGGADSQSGPMPSKRYAKNPLQSAARQSLTGSHRVCDGRFGGVGDDPARPVGHRRGRRCRRRAGAGGVRGVGGRGDADGCIANGGTPVPTPTPDPFASDRISCTEFVMANKEVHVKALLDVFSRYESKLKAIPGVHGVGIGDERVDGVRIFSQLVIIVLLDEADVDDRIPQTIEGCGVDQQVSGGGRSSSKYSSRAGCPNRPTPTPRPGARVAGPL